MSLLLSVKNLGVEFAGKQTVTALKDISFELNDNDTLAMVGESGSGKSTAALALIGLLPIQARVTAGAIWWHQQKNKQNLLTSSAKALGRLRGRHIAMVSQNPATALNPCLNIQTQLTEHMVWHRLCSPRIARRRAIDLLAEMGLDRQRSILNAYPHQFSGGQQQRIAIAMALAAEPQLLIADEPTTALDTTVQAQILELLQKIQQERKMAMIYISHDLRVVSQISNHLLILRHGSIVEAGKTAQIINTPRSQYAKTLIAALNLKKSAAGGDSDIVLSVKKLNVSYAQHNNPKARLQALKNINLDFYKGSITGIVGESGAGKSTLARAALRLLSPDSGELYFQKAPYHHYDRKAMMALRPHMQMIFQNPYMSLNPRLNIQQILSEALFLHRIVEPSLVKQRVAQLLTEVGLDPAMSERYPHQFSGGQRQRIALARAISTNPKIIFADEPLSALDVLVQKHIMDLLKDLVQKRQLSIVFITHDLSAARHLCQHLVVMQAGAVIEMGDTETIYTQPQKAFTQSLLNAQPRLRSISPKNNTIIL